MFFTVLLYIQAAIALGLLVLLLISLTNLYYLKRLGSYRHPDRWPRISVLVPARNEESCISDCVKSLLAQQYTDFQLIVLDDNSTDRTWEILQGYAHNDPRLRLIKGKPLPDDWLGKHWACQQLAETADGELLLFVDADTYHQPDMLRAAASAMSTEQAALISALPRQDVMTWSEKLSIPAFYLGMMCGVPLELTRLQSNPLLFAVLGQFLIFRREAYEAVGGYASVKQNIVDDIAIGRRVHAMGLKYRLLDGNGEVSCRMYHNFKEVWRGLTKSAFATFSFNPYFLVLMWTLVIIVFIVPLLILIVGLAVPQVPIAITMLAGLSVLLTLILWAWSHIRFHFPVYLVLIYPASAIFMTVIAIASMILTMQGKAMWKDRLMPKFVRL